MDERLRRFERAARDGDALTEVRRIRERLRAGVLTAERAELLAHIGHENTRVALGLSEPKPIETPEENLAWWRTFARFGREAGVRGALALARPHLCASVWGHDRFAGVSEEAWHGIEALEDWVRAPSEERVAAFQRAVTAAVEAPEPAGGAGILVAISGLITATDYEEAIVQLGQGAPLSREGFESLLARMRKDLVPWALGEPDPLSLREREEGRHFGADPDISRSVSFSSDGRLVLSSSRGGAVMVRDAVTGAIVRAFERVRGEIFSAAFSPDAVAVLATGQWGPCRLLDVATGALVREIPQKDAQDVAFVDDSRALIAGDGPRLALWDVNAGREVRVFEGHERMVTHVLVTPTGRVVSASSDQTVRVWDLETGAQLASWPQPESIGSVVLSPDGRSVLVGLSYGKIRLLDLETGVDVKTFQSDRGSVYGLSFLPDGSGFVSVISSRGTWIEQWSLASSEPVRTWESFHALTFHVAVAPDGKRFNTGDREGGLRAYPL